MSHSNLINKANRQTIEAFLEKNVWKISESFIYNPRKKAILKDENELVPEHAEILRESVLSAKNNDKTFKKGADLIKNALKD